MVKLDNNSEVKLQIWDTAGQESFKSIIKAFYRNVSAVFLVYNIASLNSFKELEFWYSQAVENCDPEVIFVLIGAQKDRETE
jgi:Ras-related protein Rab-2A